jgi:hypothetical protein
MNFRGGGKRLQKVPDVQVPDDDLGAFEPPTSWVRFRALVTRHSLESRMASGFAPLTILSPTKSDMRGYAAIAGVFRQKC